MPGYRSSPTFCAMLHFPRAAILETDIIPRTRSSCVKFTTYTASLSSSLLSVRLRNSRSGCPSIMMVNAKNNFLIDSEIYIFGFRGKWKKDIVQRRNVESFNLTTIHITFLITKTFICGQLWTVYKWLLSINWTSIWMIAL